MGGSEVLIKRVHSWRIYVDKTKTGCSKIKVKLKKKKRKRNDRAVASAGLFAFDILC